MRIECPHCHTIYPHEQLGLPDDIYVRATVHCSVCEGDFEVVLSHRSERVSLPWHKRALNTVMRRPHPVQKVSNISIIKRELLEKTAAEVAPIKRGRSARRQVQQ